MCGMSVWSIGIALCLGVNACTDVNGGAVELSWKLRPASSSNDIFVDCDAIPMTNPVTGIRLSWHVGSETGSQTWDCTDYHGVTGFDLPVGTAELSVTPRCANGDATTNTYTAPAPEQRMVIVGSVISLGAVELIVEDTDCSDTHPCICQ